MADAAVRVDIIVGQNTVVPAVERTSAALQGATRSASTMNVGFENLSTRGMRKVEAGFQNLAARAVGLQGPWSKVVEGMLLLGAGSTVVLGLAAGTTIIGKLIEYIRDKSTEADRAIRGATKSLEEFLNPKDPLADQIAAVNEQISLLQMRMTTQFADPQDLIRWGMEVIRLQKLLEDVNAKRRPPEKEKSTKPAKSGKEWDGTLGSWMPEVVAPEELQMAIRENISEPLAEATQAWQDYNAEVANGIAQQESVFEMVNTLGPAFESLAEGIGAAIAGYGNMARVMVQAAAQAITAIARMHAKKELAEAAEKFAEGAWPPNPAAIAAGVKHLQAAALWNLVAGAAGVAGNIGAAAVGRGAATGGVSGDRMSRDQQDMGRMGTVTVRLGDRGFIDPKSPVFQEWLAQVIKEAKGRNVVFA